MNAFWRMRRSMIMGSVVWATMSTAAEPTAGDLPPPSTLSLSETSAPEPAVHGTPQQVLPARIHAGTVLQAELTGEALPWMDLDKALAARAFVPGANPEAESVISRAPAADRAYALVTIEIDAGRSIGKADYSLAAGGVSWPGLALRVGDGPCDPRNWQLEAKGASLRAVVVYEIPPDTREAVLTMSLPVTLPEPSVPLQFAFESPASAENAEPLPPPAVEAVEAVVVAPLAAEAEKPAATPDATPAEVKPATETPTKRPARSDWW